MAFVNIYKRPVVTVFRSSLFSKAIVYRLFGLICTILLPLIIAYRTQGFWLTTSTYIEQPDVHFKKQMILIATTAQNQQYLAWSTYPNFNSLLGDNLRVPTVSSFESDPNGDGKFDSLDLTVKVPLGSGESITGFQLLLLFDYQLSRHSYVRMESLGVLQHQSSSDGAQLSAFGDLALVQRTPLYHSGTDIRYDTSLINGSSIELSEYDLDRIYPLYQQRNVTTRIDNLYSTWKSGRGAGEPFTIKLQLSYPLELITYHPGFWELVKWGWVQYFAILYLFVWFFDLLNDAVIGGRLFNCVVVRPRVKIE